MTYRRMIAIPACFLAMMFLITASNETQGQDKKEPEKKGFPGGKGGPGGGAGFGRGMMGGGIGKVMPEFIANMLKLTDEQKKSFEELQKEVDAKMDKILNDEQKKQIKEMREGRGFPGAPGGPGGPGGFPGRGKGGPGGKDGKDGKKIDD